MRGWWTLLLAAWVLVAGASGQGAGVDGVWQGTLKLPGREMRLEMKIAKSADGRLSTDIYNVDRAGAVIAVTTTSVTGADVKLSVVTQGIEYDGKLNVDRTGMTGTFVQGGQSFALDLVKVTEAAAWAIPAAPPPVKAMPANARPVFEIATIKPAKADEQGHGMTVEGRSFMTRNTSLVDLMTFAYGVQQKQIVGAPAWAAQDKYDVTATPDIEGQPNQMQLRSMVRKLLETRFELKFHMEKKELGAYVLTVAKAGLKMTPGDPQGMPGLFFQGPGILMVRSATLLDFAQLMETTVLDRPVVHQTGLAGRYDYVLKWTPDDSQFVGIGVTLSPPTNAPDAPPDLFTAMQQQMGLRMASSRLPVDVMVMDGAAKPSAN